MAARFQHWFSALNWEMMLLQSINFACRNTHDFERNGFLILGCWKNGMNIPENYQKSIYRATSNSKFWSQFLRKYIGRHFLGYTYRMLSNDSLATSFMLGRHLCIIYSTHSLNVLAYLWYEGFVDESFGQICIKRLKASGKTLKNHLIVQKN